MGSNRKVLLNIVQLGNFLGFQKDSWLVTTFLFRLVLWQGFATPVLIERFDFFELYHWAAPKIADRTPHLESSLLNHSTCFRPD